MIREQSEVVLPAQVTMPDASEAILVINRHGVVRFAPLASTRLLGYEPDKVVGRSVLRFVASEQRDRVTEHWLAFLSAPAVQSSELTVVVVDGSDNRARVRVSVWRLPGYDQYLLLLHIIDRLRDRLETLYSIMAAVSGTLELDEVCDIVLRETKRLIPCECSTLMMVDSGNRLHMVKSQGRTIANFPAEVLDNLTDYTTFRIIRETGQPLVIGDVEHDPRWVPSSKVAHIKSWLGVPLIHGGQFLGALNLDAGQANAFDSEDVELARALATQVATAISNARRYEEEQRRARRYQALNEVTLAISHLDLHSVLALVYAKINELMDASSFSIGLHDPEAGLIRVMGAYERGQPLPDRVQSDLVGLSGLVLRTRRKIILHDSTTQELPLTDIEGDIPRSLLMMPLIAQDQTVGVISVQSDQPHAYTSDDISMLETVAGSVATVLQNAQLYDQTADRLAAQEALHRMGLASARVADQDLDCLIELAIRTALELFSPAQVRLILFARPEWTPRRWRGHATGDPDQPNIRPCDREPVEPVMAMLENSDDVLLRSDLSEQLEFQAGFGTPWLVQAVAAHPLSYRDEKLGALLLLFSEPHFFRHDELRTFDLLCMQIATTLENKRVSLQVRSRLDEVSALQDLARQVSSSQTLDDILNTVVSTIVDVYQCSSASIYLLDPAQQEIVTRATVGIDPQCIDLERFKVGEHAAGRVIKTGQVVYVPDTAQDPNFESCAPDIRSLMSVPLTVQDNVIGALSIESTVPDAFTADHERVLTIAGGQIAAAIETVRLLGEARERAAELAEANTALTALDDLRNELVQNVTHELRSPLALVRGYVALLRDSQLGPITTEQADALRIVDQKSASIARMINDILALEQIRPETLALDIVDMNELCQQSVEGAQLVYAKRGLRFEADLVAGEQAVVGDRDRLNQVLDNLLGNAAKFSPDNGLIVVQTRRDESGQFLDIAVTDHGIGIPADKLARVFERFYQADLSIKHRFGGVGLGLSIVRRIVEAHSGSVSVCSEEGKGSTFTVRLPLIEPK